MRTSLAQELKNDILTAETTESQFAAYIDNFRSSSLPGHENILCVLQESHNVYLGRSDASMMRMRSYALSTLFDLGVPDDAIGYIIDILENSHHAYAVASAARTVRAMEKPHPEMARYLVKSISNIWKMDKPVSFETFEHAWPLSNYTTALDEIFTSLSWMGAYAKAELNDLVMLRDECKYQFNPSIFEKMCDCIEVILNDERTFKTCCIKPLKKLPSFAGNRECGSLNQIQLQDQEGHLVKWGEYFSGKYSLVAFFYVTCTNPKKCSQTIYNLAEIQRLLNSASLSQQVNLAAITYTSEQDSPDELKNYGHVRGLEFNDRCKMFRCSNGAEQLTNALNLQVNYIGQTVNQHSIELFLFNETGELLRTFTRVQTDPNHIVSTIAKLA